MVSTTETNPTGFRAAGDLVIHGDQATLFGPVGMAGPVGTPVRAVSRAYAATPAAASVTRGAIGETAARVGQPGRRRTRIVAAIAGFEQWGS
jgi:hypothetical protein